MNRRRNYRYEKPQWELEKEKAAREKEEERIRNLERTDENYPQLGRTVSAKPTWGGGKKFTELAKEWKQDDDERKANEEYEALRKKREEYRGFVMPQFQLTHRYEEEDDDIPAPSPSPVAKEENDEWVSIDRSAKTFARLQRKQAREDERMKRRDAGIESSSESGSSSGEEDTCWESTVAAPMGKNAY